MNKGGGKRIGTCGQFYGGSFVLGLEWIIYIIHVRVQPCMVLESSSRRHQIIHSCKFLSMIS